MPKINIPEDQLRVIKLEDLLENVQFMKHNGLRLNQACAAWINNQYELSYSFVDDSTYGMITLRVLCDLDAEVPSIGEFYPYAVFYENEMESLFGVHMRMMNLDYHTKLYRVKKWAAMLPEDVREQKVAMKKEKSVVPGATEQPDESLHETVDALEKKHAAASQKALSAKPAAAEAPEKEEE